MSIYLGYYPHYSGENKEVEIEPIGKELWATNLPFLAPGTSVKLDRVELFRLDNKDQYAITANIKDESPFGRNVILFSIREMTVGKEVREEHVASGSALNVAEFFARKEFVAGRKLARRA